MKILHFSDIHFAAPTLNPLQIFSKRLIGNLNYFFNRRKAQSHKMLDELVDTIDSYHPDLILISGDFTTTGHRNEYKRAQHLLEKLSHYPVYAIPGNHDAYTKSSQKRNPFYHYLERYLPIEGEFGYSLKEDRVAPFIIEEGTWLILLDCSMYSSLIHSNGHFTPQIESNLSSLLEKIPASDTIFLACHYPFFGHEAPHRRMINHEKLYALIAKHPNIQLYLHGHTHRHAAADLRPNQLPMVLDAGSISEIKRSTFNLIDTKTDEVNVYRYQSGFKPELCLMS